MGRAGEGRGPHPVPSGAFLAGQKQAYHGRRRRALPEQLVPHADRRIRRPAPSSRRAVEKGTDPGAGLRRNSVMAGIKRNDNPLLVRVAVPRPVWRTYTYRFSSELSGGDLLGCRVVVPFGSSVLVGFLWGPHRGSKPRGLKKVIDRLDQSPLLPPSVLGLVEWAAGYYQAPPGMMMAAALPPGTYGRAVLMARAVEGACPVGGFPLLSSDRWLRVDKLSKEDHGKTDPQEKLRRLRARGEIELAWRPHNRPSVPTRTMISPAEGVVDLTKLAHRLKSTAPKQAELIFQLSLSDPPVPATDLLSRAKASRSSLNGLRAKGLVTESTMRVYRDPLSDLEVGEGSAPTLTEPQRSALEKVRSLHGGFGVLLLHGVTGSGKTEVYLRAIEELLREGKTALVLIPEISLTPLTVSRFEARFPGKVAVLHSGMSRGERFDSWKLIREGRRRIAVGARSAVFAPLSDLGVIVVDEEHDLSYKQGEHPHYHARDLAVARGRREGVPVILGSASPSMESYSNALSGKYGLAELPRRIDSRPMPATTIVATSDMGHPHLSDRLLAGIGKRTARGEQCIVLINRRGFAPTQVCRNCGHREICPRCGITLTYHRKGNALRCHHCPYWKPALTHCPECGADAFSHLGPGIQKVQEALGELLPQTRVIRMDADTTTGRRSHWRILSSFARGEGDVLLGTQMVAKGHDFPRVTLVGVIAADQGLAFPDFRAAERVFQLLLQVGGRAGRGDIPGEVIVQTHDPENPVIKAAAVHDYSRFWEEEISVRERFGYPPCGYLVRFVWSGRNEGRVRDAATSSSSVTAPEGVRFYRPTPAVLGRINRRYRWSALARAERRGPLSRLSSAVRERFERLRTRGVRLDVDVDPYDLL
ncbi:primosomal protein N' [Candidatus Fermentibacteria bacterium]|nr:primosomal protein N' [Candidatus Fermentibacteria bacterium]